MWRVQKDIQFSIIEDRKKKAVIDVIFLLLTINYRERKEKLRESCDLQGAMLTFSVDVSLKKINNTDSLYYSRHFKT